MVARHDLTEDPAILDDLLLVRRGTAFFARKLNELSDADLDEPSLLDGWDRRTLVSHVGYNARAVARLVDWAATGVENPMYSSPEARNEEIAYGATLQPIALRHLFEHSAIHLNVEWRDLPAEAWFHEVKTAQGRTVPASETVWMRTREVWIHAVDLNNGATFAQIPQQVLSRVLTDITGTWAVRGTLGALVLESDDGTRWPSPSGTGAPAAGEGHSEPEYVRADLPTLVQWATGRGRIEGVGPAPKWI
jgi:maleylpyruvate isomerase